MISFTIGVAFHKVFDSILVTKQERAGSWTTRRVTCQTGKAGVTVAKSTWGPAADSTACGWALSQQIAIAALTINHFLCYVSKRRDATVSSALSRAHLEY